jgi:1,4-alpha-glucan branching enzyme
VSSALLGEVDRYLIGEGRHWRLWDVVGAHVRRHDGIEGVSFAVWAPNARGVSVVGDWNHWRIGADVMRPQGSSGVWAGFVPAGKEGDRYKFAVEGVDGQVRL